MKRGDIKTTVAPSISSPSVSFADVAHQTLIFDPEEESSKLILTLLDTRWVQRLRQVRQTGNTQLVYMFAEHSRFGHSLGVAYLANQLMKHLSRFTPDLVAPYRNAVAAAALLHDIGHVAPGSHLAEHLWSQDSKPAHEKASVRIILEDPQIRSILENFDKNLPQIVSQILLEDPSLPQWTKSVISGAGWNADRGNWMIVDSAMTSVSYGRYNVAALIDAFRLTAEGELVILESRLDALTHFYVARDSMYRQVYQHRVLQGVDMLTEKLVIRLRDLIGETTNPSQTLSSLNIFHDDTLLQSLTSKNYVEELSLDSLFKMTESWWRYHVERWCESSDKILQDLALRLRDRILLKTVRLPTNDDSLIKVAEELANSFNLPSKYYVFTIAQGDKHRGKKELQPRILLDTGELLPVTEVEPLIKNLIEKSSFSRRWLVIPKEVKEKLKENLGRSR
jgi:HD superfamily phosphohydrolase